MAEQMIGFQADDPTKELLIERRVWVRTPSDRNVCCRMMPTLARGELDMGKVRNVSCGGIALILTRPRPAACGR
jgi:hypothetical protein